MLKPDVLAVLALTKDVIEDAAQLFKSPVLDSDAMKELVVRKQGKCLGRVDDKNKPFITQDPKRGEVMYQVWGHPDDPTNPEFAVILVCPKTKDDKGADMFKPDILLRGPKANVLIVGGMSCCGSMQAHWTQMRGAEPPIDSARVPLHGIAHDEHRNWLKGKVHVADTERGLNAIRHLIADVLAHRFPDDPRFNHDCGKQGNYTAYSHEARALLPT